MLLILQSLLCEDVIHQLLVSNVTSTSYINRNIFDTRIAWFKNSITLVHSSHIQTYCLNAMYNNKYFQIHMKIFYPSEPIVNVYSFETTKQIVWLLWYPINILQKSMWKWSIWWNQNLLNSHSILLLLHRSYNIVPMLARTFYDDSVMDFSAFLVFFFLYTLCIHFMFVHTTTL